MDIFSSIPGGGGEDRQRYYSQDNDWRRSKASQISEPVRQVLHNGRQIDRQTSLQSIQSVQSAQTVQLIESLDLPLLSRTNNNENLPLGNKPTGSSIPVPVRQGITRSRTFNVFSGLTSSFSHSISLASTSATPSNPKALCPRLSRPVRKPSPEPLTTSGNSNNIGLRGKGKKREQPTLSTATTSLESLPYQDVPGCVITHMPSSYWAGRFMALHDRFHNELLDPPNLSLILAATSKKTETLVENDPYVTAMSVFDKSSTSGLDASRRGGIPRSATTGAILQTSRPPVFSQSLEQIPSDDESYYNSSEEDITFTAEPSASGAQAPPPSRPEDAAPSGSDRELEVPTVSHHEHADHSASNRMLEFLTISHHKLATSSSPCRTDAAPLASCDSAATSASRGSVDTSALRHKYAALSTLHDSAALSAHHGLAATSASLHENTAPSASHGSAATSASRHKFIVPSASIAPGNPPARLVMAERESNRPLSITSSTLESKPDLDFAPQIPRRLAIAGALSLLNDEHRCRRVLHHLHALCTTDEARRSLWLWQQNFARTTKRPNLLPTGGTMSEAKRHSTLVKRILSIGRDRMSIQGPESATSLPNQPVHQEVAEIEEAHQSRLSLIRRLKTGPSSRRNSRL
ncbi:hypothetical protein B0T17DRAFT_349799 [Bombardia bombarda]|uniref:Uncharacterized protein n=1 Tax=Bombardia bombarda TaxID=252184 RepID=A0AA39WHT5_9PEZI|nr:hypothetical protein B0T17DRAFT_349799 [Bombardia bombarda]